MSQMDRSYDRLCTTDGRVLKPQTLTTAIYAVADLLKVSIRTEANCPEWISTTDKELLRQRILLLRAALADLGGVP